MTHGTKERESPIESSSRTSRKPVWRPSTRVQCNPIEAGPLLGLGKQILGDRERPFSTKLIDRAWTLRSPSPKRQRRLPSRCFHHDRVEDASGEAVLQAS